MDEPLFEHDCTDCVFLGRQDGADVYYCRQGGMMDTIIFRWSDDGPDYDSGWTLNHDLQPSLRAALVGVMGGNH